LNLRVTMRAQTVILALAALVAQAWADCDEAGYIQCGNSNCVRIRYICDGDNDCGDYSDEAAELCDIWRRSDCGRGSFMCNRRGDEECHDVETYCAFSDPPCQGDEIDPRVCPMIRGGRLRSLEDIQVDPIHLHGELDNYEAMLEMQEVFKNRTKFSMKSDDCELPYTKVGDKCLSLFYPAQLSWGEASSFCNLFDGQLFSLKNGAEEFFDLVEQLKAVDVDRDFWIGGSNKNFTNWEWIDGSQIELHTPQWAYRYRNQTHMYEQAPAEPPVGLCLALTHDKFYFMSDENCMAQKSPLCIHN